MGKIENYNVELRFHFENGYGEDDYTEEDYQFETKSEAMAFAKKNAGKVHDVREYYVDGGSKSIW